MIVSSPAHRREPAVADELGEELRVVHHLEAAAEVGVLVRERVEAVRAAGHDLRHPCVVQRRHVRLRERLEDVLVPGPPRWIAGARLARAEDRDVQAGGDEELRRRDRRRPRTLVERRGAADPVEDLRRPGLPARGRERRARPPTPPAPSAASPTGFEPRSTSRSIVSVSAGSRDSTMTRWRRRSTMWSTCSIETGHSWTQAPQVTQSQTTSSVTAFGTRALSSPPASTPCPSAKSWSRIPMIRSFGESAFPVAYAGQTS